MSVFFSFIFFLTFSEDIYAEDFYNDDYLWAQNLTETWSMFDYDDEIVSFTDSYGKAVYQILTFNAASHNDATSLLSFVADSLGAEVDMLTFIFNGHDTAITEAVWVTGNLEVRGYIIGIDDKSTQFMQRQYPHDYVLTAFSQASEFEVYNDFLMSNIDGFAPLLDEYKTPGVLSQFVRVTGEQPGTLFRTDSDSPQETYDNVPKTDSSQPSTILKTLTLPTPLQADVEAAYAVIQREARILNQFANAHADMQQAAWHRYYQMIYKDSWFDMRETASIISERFEDQGIGLEEYPGEILAWLQGFAYQRSGTLSDLEPAQVCIYNKSGDCDSLAIAYIALLDHLGIESILMLSMKHAHSLVGVNIAGPGARFPFKGTTWRVAELTANVPIGYIARDQADPADWLGFDLGINP